MGRGRAKVGRRGDGATRVITQQLSLTRQRHENKEIPAREMTRRAPASRQRPLISRLICISRVFAAPSPIAVNDDE